MSSLITSNIKNQTGLNKIQLDGDSNSIDFYVSNEKIFSVNDTNIPVMKSELNPTFQNLGNIVDSISLNVKPQMVYKLKSTTDTLTVSFNNLTDNSTPIRLITVIIEYTEPNTLITWPLNIKWPDSMEPTASYVQNSYDVWTFLSYDSGISFFGSLDGSNYGNI